MNELKIQVLPLNRNEYVLSTLKVSFKNITICILIALIILGNIIIILSNYHLDTNIQDFYIIGLDIFIICYFGLIVSTKYKKYAKNYKEKQEFVSISQDGIKMWNSVGFKMDASWNIIREIKNEPKLLAIYAGKNKRIMIIPKCSFHSEIEVEQFVSKMEEYWRNAKAP